MIALVNWCGKNMDEIILLKRKRKLNDIKEDSLLGIINRRKVSFSSVPW